MMRCLLLRVGSDRFALPVDGVRHIAPAAHAVRLPRVGPPVEGIAAYGPLIVPQIRLGALLGVAGDEDGGAIAVVTASGAGEIALRVSAAERVVELAARERQALAGDGIVVARVQRGRSEIGVLDLSRLSLARDELPHLPEALRAAVQAPGSLAAAELPVAEIMLVCRAGDRLLSLPLERVAAVEAGRGERPLLELGRAFDSAARATGAAVILRLADGELGLGVDQVVGLRHADGVEGRPRRLDLDSLIALGRKAGLVRQPDIRPAVAARRTAPLFLLSADSHSILVPRIKVAQVGPADRWRDMPPGHGRLAGVVAIGRSLLPALDLGGLFGVARRRRAMVASVEAAGQAWGFACDAVADRRAVIEGRPHTAGNLPLLGVARTAEGELPVLDVDRIDFGRMPA